MTTRAAYLIRYVDGDRIIEQGYRCIPIMH